MENTALTEFQQALWEFMKTGGAVPAARLFARTITPSSIDDFFQKGINYDVLLGISKTTTELASSVSEICRNMQRSEMSLPPALNRMRYMSDFLRYLYVGRQCEFFTMLCFDAEGRVIGARTYEVLHRCFALDMRIILLDIEDIGADSIVLCRNFNAISNLPLERIIEDMHMIENVLRLKDIILIDFFVITARTAISFREAGYLVPRSQPSRHQDCTLYQNWMKLP